MLFRPQRRTLTRSRVVPTEEGWKTAKAWTRTAIDFDFGIDESVMQIIFIFLICSGRKENQYLHLRITLGK